MEDNARHSSLVNSVLGALFSLLASAYFTYAFWGNYMLAINPAYSNANVVALEKYSIRYRYCDLISGRCYERSRQLQSNESKRYSDSLKVRVIYPRNRPDLDQMPSLHKPLPIIFYLTVNLLIIAAFGSAIVNFIKLLNG